MTSNAFYEEGSQILTAAAFEFVLDTELKRAVRSQNFLTLIVLETSREWDGMTITADDGTVHQVAQVITKEVRDTDLIGLTAQGVLSLVLIDADFEHSTHVIDRLVSRIDSYEFPSPLRIAVGAACYPTHAVDAGSLKQQAISHPIVNWRGGLRPSVDQN
jgi:hypothetical protein